MSDSLSTPVATQDSIDVAKKATPKRNTPKTAKPGTKSTKKSPSSSAEATANTASGSDKADTPKASPTKANADKSAASAAAKSPRPRSTAKTAAKAKSTTPATQGKKAATTTPSMPAEDTPPADPAAPSETSPKATKSSASKGRSTKKTAYSNAASKPDIADTKTAQAEDQPSTADKNLGKSESKKAPAAKPAKATARKPASRKPTATQPEQNSAADNASGSATGVAAPAPEAGASAITTSAAKATNLSSPNRRSPKKAPARSSTRTLTSKPATKAAHVQQGNPQATAGEQADSINAPAIAQEAATQERQATAPVATQVTAAQELAAPAPESAEQEKPEEGTRRGRSRGRGGRNHKKRNARPNQTDEAEQPRVAGQEFDDVLNDDVNLSDPAESELNDDFDDVDNDAAERDASSATDGGKRNSGRNGKKGKGQKAKTQQDDAAPDQEPAVSKSKRKMFVSVFPGEQIEVVLTEDGNVQEYYLEMLHQAKIKGNIYKGVIHNIDPNLQAAFVSYGAAKNGFLQIDEVHPEYYNTPHESGKGHKYPLIQKVLKPGQEILVQVVKEPAGTKGAFLTSYLSMPGRFLVLTPGREQIGVSRKVEDEEERSRLRAMLSGLNPGPGLGVIVRTVSIGASKTSLHRDLQFLKRVWRDVRKKGSTDEAPALIYQELGLAARSVRDYLTEEVTELWIDNAELAEELNDVVAQLFPRKGGLIHVHKDGSQTLFERFNLRKQLEQIKGREVVLPSGGRLVFDHTEALTAIDINSGRTGGKTNFEEMAYKINMEAAAHIPLQLRLRDIGGQVVIDFIEMRDRSHWRDVERTFRNAMRVDRARHDVAKISSFGLLQVVRQRLGSSALSITMEPCPFCNGTGQRRNMEWQAIQALRDIERMARNTSAGAKPVVYTESGELVLYLLNAKREQIMNIEKDYNVKIEIRPDFSK